MSSECSLGELLSCLIDYRGKTPPKSTSGIKLITAKVIKNGSIDERRLEYISEETYKTWMRRGFPRRGDILITTEAPLGEIAQLRTDEPVALAQRVILVRADPVKVDSQYLFHWLRSPLARARLRQRSSGTTVSGIRQPELRAVPIELPPRASQERIGAILDAIDDFIENNRRRIALLEGMMQAIYREWFVHFRYPGRADDELVESTLGPIPIGWEVTKVGLSFATVLGGTPSRRNPAYWSGDVPWLNSGKTNELRVIEPSEYITALGLARSSTKLMPPKTTLIAITGATLGQVSMLEAEMCANQSVVGVYDESGSHGEWIYRTFVDRIEGIVQSASGGAQQHINKGVIENVLFAHPPSRVLAEFNDAVGPAGDEVATLLRSNRSLESIRDIVLPELMAGAIDVSKLELDTLVEESAV